MLSKNRCNHPKGWTILFENGRCMVNWRQKNCLDQTLKRSRIVNRSGRTANCTEDFSLFSPNLGIYFLTLSCQHVQLIPNWEVISKFQFYYSSREEISKVLPSKSSRVQSCPSLQLSWSCVSKLLIIFSLACTRLVSLYQVSEFICSSVYLCL